jgi:chromosome partitioning protein
MARIIAVTNQKGGVGKTTTAVNLSAVLAHKHGKRVLLVDFDPQGNASSGFGITLRDKDKSIYHVLIEDLPIREVFHDTAIPRLQVVPSAMHLTGAEIELVNLEQRERRLKGALEPIAAAYDFIIIDCPPSLGILTVNALVAAHSLIIPLQAEYYALEGLAQLLKTIKSIRHRLNRRLEVEGVLLTMYDGRTKISQQIEKEVKEYFSEQAFSAIIPRNVKLSEAPSHGQPIVLYAARSQGARGYDELAKELLSREEERTGSGTSGPHPRGGPTG